MTWENVAVLVAVPFALCAIWWMFRRSSAAAGTVVFANIKQLWADRRGLSESPARLRQRARGICLALGALGAVLALARPQWGTIEETTFDQSREVMIALDLSRSMLADDVKPTRLARAKLLIEALLDQLKGERVGLVVFAGSAFVQSPLSADYEVMRDLLKDLDPSYLPQGGTNYGSMLGAAAKGFGESGDGDRFLVVLSDGEAHDDQWQAHAADLRDHGVRIIGLGVGTAEGALLPAENGGLLKDEAGGAVLSRLAPRTLQQLAEQTHGVYRDASVWVDIADLVGATVDQGVKGQYIEQKQVHQQDRFQWFLAPALLFFLLSYWIELPVFPAARKLQRATTRPQPVAASVVRAAAVLLVALLAPRLGAAIPAQQPNTLETTVAELAAKPHLAATDFAHLAQQTIDFASKPEAPAGPSRSGVIDDALAGVGRGEVADAHAADWPTLRTQLEQLKQAQQQQPPDQPPPQDSQQNQDGGQQDQQNAQPNDQQQQGQGSDQNEQGAQQDGDKQRQQGSAGADTKDQHAENDQNEPNGARGGEEPDKKDDTTQPRGGTAQRDGAPQDGGDAKDHKALASPDAGLGDLDPGKPQEEAKEKAEPASPTRMVGGGSGQPEKGAETDPALAEALGKLERIKDRDAPAVLFDRMSQADNPRPPRATGKNW